MNNDQFSRTRLLFGEEALLRFQRARVAVLGLGGVGSYAVEALARSGIGFLRLVDFDRVNISNLNRQLPALHSTLGRLKTEVMQERIRDINPECVVEIYSGFFSQEVQDELLEGVDFVLDAIDSLGPKAGLLEQVFRRKIPVIACLGAASRFDPSRIELADIAQTHTCPLARKLRKYLHRRGIESGIPVIYSTEPPISQFPPAAGTEEEWGESRGRIRGTLGSSSYLPAIVGLWAASYILRQLASSERINPDKK
ncbi:MAG: tRNA threonylcarbamoyladenosine dehydratase [Candidatus Cloacimonetes bacterium]|nr:tRNA threonylcarbamoyladenosine dehydratase [Candidatus Cloacimonadota bacterium]